MLKPGWFVYFTMMGSKCYYFEHATYDSNHDMYKVEFETIRLKVQPHFINFTMDEDDLKKKFSMFEPLHVGYYDLKLREDEGSDFHYTFFGKKEII